MLVFLYISSWNLECFITSKTRSCLQQAHNFDSRAISGGAQETIQKLYRFEFCVISMKLSLVNRLIKRIYPFLAKDNAVIKVSKWNGKWDVSFQNCHMITVTVLELCMRVTYDSEVWVKCFTLTVCISCSHIRLCRSRQANRNEWHFRTPATLCNEWVQLQPSPWHGFLRSC